MLVSMIKSTYRRYFVFRDLAQPEDTLEVFNVDAVFLVELKDTGVPIFLFLKCKNIRKVLL